MPGGLEVVITIAGVAAGAVLLSVLWTVIQREVGIREKRLPREEAELQMHQAQRNGSADFGP